MPLFGRKQDPVPTQAAPVQTHHHATRTSTSSRNPRHSTSGGGGLFSRRRSNSSLSSSDLEHSRRGTRRSGASTTGAGTGIAGGLFSRANKHEDPSISAARDRVLAAEQSERDADHALQMAKNSVREAREHVRRIELEAEADAKAAKLKQGQAKDLGRRAKPLGRKFGI